MQITLTLAPPQAAMLEWVTPSFPGATHETVLAYIVRNGLYQGALESMKDPEVYGLSEAIGNMPCDHILRAGRSTVCNGLVTYQRGPNAKPWHWEHLDAKDGSMWRLE